MTKPTTPAAQRLLARSRGKAAPPKRPHPMPVPGLAEGSRLRAKHALAFDAVVAGKPLLPPGRKGKP